MPEQWKPPTREEFAERTRKTLASDRREWDRVCKDLGWTVSDWQPTELLRDAVDKLTDGDPASQAEALEKLRVAVSYKLLERATAENNIDLHSSSSRPMGGLRADPADVQRGKATLSFFGGTAGERVFVDHSGLRLPWVFDEKHYTRKTNVALREALLALFPDTQAAADKDLSVPPPTE